MQGEHSVGLVQFVISAQFFSFSVGSIRLSQFRLGLFRFDLGLIKFHK